METPPPEAVAGNPPPPSAATAGTLANPHVPPETPPNPEVSGGNAGFGVVFGRRCGVSRDAMASVVGKEGFSMTDGEVLGGDAA